MTPVRSEWDAATGPGRLAAALAETGLAWVRAPALVEAAEREPWAAAERLLGERPWLVERQPIRSVPGGRSFASGSMPAPFHSDSQMLHGVPPHVQVMACHRAAEVGGEGLYLDTWTLLTRVERKDPALFACLFATIRRIPFVFGDVFGPTVSRRGDSLVFTHGARPLPDDALVPRLRPYLESTPVMEVRAEAGDIVLIHNHRVLHGRRAFEDGGRAFTRVLIWRHRPWPAPGPWLERATACALALSERLQDAPVPIRTAFGLAEPTSADVGHRLGIVLELLRGVPAGMLSAREGVSEPELYGWRDAVLSGAAERIASPAAGRPSAEELEDWRRRVV